MWVDNLFMKNNLMNKKVNDFDALVIGLIATLLFFGILWVIFVLILENPFHRLFILLGGSWPEGIIQFLTFFPFFWALIMLGSKSRHLDWENKAMLMEYLPKDEHTVILPDEINQLRLNLSDIEEWKDSILVKTLKMACTKFRANKSVQETLDVVQIQSEMNLNYLDSSYSVIRYLAWSIPSIGFIGTVTGISSALGNVDRAAAGDLSAVTSQLGVAFDTTLISLFLSIILMFRVHKVQQTEELFIVSVQDYLMTNFVNRIYVPKAER